MQIFAKLAIRWRKLRISVKNGVIAEDDPPEISWKDLARIACIKEYYGNQRNGVILHVQKNVASLLKECCMEMSDLLNREFLQEKWTNQKSLARILQNLAFIATIAGLLHFCARIMHYLARSCKKLARIFQVLSDRLTRCRKLL